MSERQCWYDKTRNCKCKSDEECLEVIFEHAKLVYCNDKECAFNLELPYKHFADRGKNYKPFADDYFDGICTRKDLALSPTKIFELKVNKKITSCRMRADKSLKRPKLPDPDNIQGGRYEDPHSADWGTSAFGVR